MTKCLVESIEGEDSVLVFVCLGFLRRGRGEPQIQKCFSPAEKTVALFLTAGTGRDLDGAQITD